MTDNDTERYWRRRQAGEFSGLHSSMVDAMDRYHLNQCHRTGCSNQLPDDRADNTDLHAADCGHHGSTQWGVVRIIPSEPDDGRTTPVYFQCSADTSREALRWTDEVLASEGITPVAKRWTVDELDAP